MILGKSIRIYLQEGSVAGIKLAEVVNLTIQALSCPRVKISDLNNNFKSQINTQGVYFLIGTDDKTAKSKVYIGEGENVWERLKSHALAKDFWNEVILFTSKDDNLTKSHVKYLESRLVINFLKIRLGLQRLLIKKIINSNKAIRIQQRLKRN